MDGAFLLYTQAKLANVKLLLICLASVAMGLLRILVKGSWAKQTHGLGSPMACGGKQILRTGKKLLLLEFPLWRSESKSD